MSPQVTFKSNEEKVPQGGREGALVDSGGRPVPAAPRLSSVVATPFSPSHGRSPRQLPPAPSGLQDLGAAAALRVTGPDREKWLQGMQSNDLAAAPYGGAVAAAFLNGKGRLVAEALLWRFTDEVIITTDRADALLAHLDRLLIMEDCELSRAQGLHRLRYVPGAIPPHFDIAGSLQPLGFEMLLPERDAYELLDQLPERVAPDALEAWRVALGVPAWGRELDEETTVLEAGLDRELSFDKGCYVGQEVVAMATFRGRVSWNLVRLEVEGAAPAPGTRLDPSRGSAKGRVTSAVQVGDNSVFLGYVHKELIVPGSTVALEGGRTATVLGLPYGSRPGAGQCA
jgi:folate-binding protein YgfZ